MYKRPKINKNRCKKHKVINLRVDTNDWSCERFKIKKNKNWIKFMKKYIPYKKNNEDEGKLIDFVEDGIHPFDKNKIYGRKAFRSVFDYLSYTDIDEIILIMKVNF